MTTLFHDDPNHLDTIDSIWVWISEDATGEGVIAVPLMGPDFGPVPLIAADKARLDDLRPWAEAMGKRTKKRVKLIRLSHREDVEVINPPGSSRA